eukprot:TRINITY_DN618_c0_g1_i3.p1 TRINITY_DN618_c0_g1~~TRINITY_DN618_c0_g1_i3.p1  ORF type:complete len:441 (+),score=-25.48 TRINITY_DN618_c0_g1_i3:343-1665(+)
MRMYDIIMKKRDGNELTENEIKFFIEGYTKGDIPDYQVSALLMAIYFRGMTDNETAFMTMEMAGSGDMVDLSPVPGIKVDKHSTGGVGDKTTLIISSIVASLGVPVAKMSGRGLGHTGGTIDKMESIPGMRIDIGREEFLNIVKTVGASVIGQSGNLDPADKKLYALRDVTATVESIPLIACSIMSKKIAAGSDCILLDVKCGSGAFMETLDDAIKLAEVMVSIGEKVGRKTIALITDMDRPLGYAIGNSLEIEEVCETIKGKGPLDLEKICIDLAGNMLYLANKGTIEDCREMAKETIKTGKAFNKLKEIIKAQGGDIAVIEDNSKFEKAKVITHVKASKDGFITHFDTKGCGTASMVLGAGRTKKEDSIDYSAGIILKKQLGDKVCKDETLALLYSSSKYKCDLASPILLRSIKIGEEKPKDLPIIRARVTVDGTQKY